MEQKAKGKPAGFKKNKLVIKDSLIEPYHIIAEEDCFTLMKNRNTMPEGHYTSLAAALTKISKAKCVIDSSENDEAISLKEYITKYNEISNSIINTITI